MHSKTQEMKALHYYTLLIIIIIHGILRLPLLLDYIKNASYHKRFLLLYPLAVLIRLTPASTWHLTS